MESKGWVRLAARLLPLYPLPSFHPPLSFCARMPGGGEAGLGAGAG